MLSLWSNSALLRRDRDRTTWEAVEVMSALSGGFNRSATGGSRCATVTDFTCRRMTQRRAAPATWCPINFRLPAVQASLSTGQARRLGGASNRNLESALGEVFERLRQVDLAEKR